MKEIVSIDIEDILECAKDIIITTHGGISHSDVKYIGDTKKLMFEIPQVSKKGCCNKLLEPTEEGGCGDTGGACICGRRLNHKGNCECKLCGEMW